MMARSSMLCALALAGSPSIEDLRADDAEEVNYLEVSIDVEGALIGTEWLDIEADGQLELCLTVLAPDKSRELRFHRMAGQTIELVAFRVVPVRDDAIAFGLAELRDDAGRELFFLTRSGVWSFSLAKQGYRGNVERVLQSDLIYDVADPDTLPRWEYILPGETRDALLLPTQDGFALFGPIDGAETPYAALTDFPKLARPQVAINQEREQKGGSFSMGPEGFSIDSGSSDDEQPPFMPSADSKGETFLSNQRHVDAPALLDIDGDGLLDMVFQADASLAIHLNHGGRFSKEPDRKEPYPAYLHKAPNLFFVDLDGDGDKDIVCNSTDREERSGLGSRKHVIVLLLNDGERLLPEEPSQVLRFEANDVTFKLLDADADGRMDLAIRKFEMPSLVAALSQFELKLTDLLFLGEQGARPVSRKPLLKNTRSFNGDNITQVAPNRSWKQDCTGDGIADQVEVDIEGKISILPVTRSKSFFGGTSWEVASSPWFQARAASRFHSIEVMDLNNDGLGDIISPGPKRLLLLFSVPSKR